MDARDAKRHAVEVALRNRDELRRKLATARRMRLDAEADISACLRSILKEQRVLHQMGHQGN